MAVTIFDIDVKLKPVIYRVDYNVPIVDGKVVGDYRIRQTIPTLDYLLREEAKVVILSHLGRPEGKYDAAYSLRPVAQHLLSYYGKVQINVTDALFGDEILQALQRMKPGSIFMLGNTRFYPEEESGDFQFARRLVHLGEVYVSDAFGVSHRHDATVAELPKMMSAYPGALMTAEVEALSRLRDHAKSPFCALIGGAKLETKVALLKALTRHADYILVGGAIANTFAKAAGQDVGQSYVEDEYVSMAHDLLQAAGEKIVLPVDYVRDGRKDAWRNVDIGPQTVALFTQYLQGARDILWNGTMGIAEEARFANGTMGIAQELTKVNGVVTVAGGDTVAFLEQHKLVTAYSFVSTGGGAALAFVAGEPMPGLEALNI